MARVCQGDEVEAVPAMVIAPKPSLLSAWVLGKTKLVEALHIGPGKLRWPPVDA